MTFPLQEHPSQNRLPILTPNSVRFFGRTAWSVVLITLFTAISNSVCNGQEQQERPNKLEKQQTLLNEIKKLKSVADKSISPKNGSEKGYLFVFVKDDCPIANAYVPEINLIHSKYKDKGIVSFLVYPTFGVTKESVLSHKKEYSINLPQVVDSNQKFAKHVKAKVTPEAFLVSAKGEVLYRGRIDDLYAGYGKKRVKANRKDLVLATELLLKGKRPETKKTKPYGCFIHFEK